MLMWTPAADPRLHPLWEQEVELELQMMRMGADRFRDSVIRAEARNKMTAVVPVRHLMADWLPGIADTIRGWLKDVSRAKGGPKPIAAAYLRDMDPHVAGLIALRAILDGLAHQRVKLVGLAMAIGGTCEHEQRVRLWEMETPELYHHYREEMDENHSSASHRRAVNINRFNESLKRGEVQWDSWSNEARFRVGIALIDCVVRKTGWFEIAQDPEHVFRKAARSPALVLQPKAALKEWLARAFDRAEILAPAYAPTIIPPRRWDINEDDGLVTGGYHTPYVKAPRLVRFKASQEGQQMHAADEYDALDMPYVYRALHLLQETAWQINKRVLDVALTLWPKAGPEGIAGLPGLDERELPPRTPRMAEHREAQQQARSEGRPVPEPDEETDREILEWKRRAHAIYRYNSRRFSRSLSASTTLLMAQQYADYPAIYFPHKMDFRGRYYPVPRALTPQGNDLARGLLTFAEGLPITEDSDAAGWLAIHLANAWGNDKVNFDKRIAWVFDNEDLWRRIAADPMANLEWTVTEGPNKVGSPFQALAAIFEWVDFLDTGYGFVSHLPVMVDGTCNGIQHLSALLRDEVAGYYVNLVPSEKPQDIYKVVATGNDAWTATDDAATDEAARVAVEGLQRVLERIARAGGPEGAKASYWLELTGYDLPRTLTKRPVMVLPYGGTKDSFFTYVREWLDEADPAPVDVPVDIAAQCEAASICLIHPDGKAKNGSELVRDLRTARIVFCAAHMWDTVKQTVRGAEAVMGWLQDCAKAVAVANQPIYWRVPSGFVVRHFYGKDKAVKCEIKLDGERVQLRRHDRTAELSIKEQTQGIAPNYIHSLDAACLTDMANRCREAGIKALATVHDAYGTHAANMNALSRFTREAFVAVHSEDLLGAFRADCQRVLVDYLVAEEGLDVLDAAEKADAMLPPPLEVGNLDIAAVLQSDYFFA